MPKFFITIISLSLVIQIIFSFFYSSDIITQNTNLANNQTKYNSLKLEVESLEKQLSDINSIKNISTKVIGTNSQFIQDHL